MALPVEMSMPYSIQGTEQYVPLFPWLEIGHIISKGEGGGGGSLFRFILWKPGLSVKENKLLMPA